MYRIIAYDSPTDRTGHVVFDPRVNRQISDGKLNLKESEIDDLSLTVNQANYLFGNVKPLQTHVEVYQDNSLLFRGRALDLTREMKDSGQFVQSFVFESIQNYLQDTSQRWAKVQNTTPKQFFQRLIDTHNSQVPDYKKFTVRTVDVTNSTDNVYRYIEDGATTWDTIKDKLVSRLGGFICVEYVDGVNYIDYLQSPGKEHNNDTPIIIGKNLQSASVQVDPTEVITQLVPLGATIEQNETNPNPDTQVSQPRIDIKSVNGGKDYLDIPDLQKEFGIIRKSVQWDDVHEPAILLSKAKQWIQAQSSAKESWTVNALELPILESFKVSDRYLFNNQAIASPQMLRVTGKTIDLLHWQKSTLTIAEKASSLSDYQLGNKRAAELQKKQTQQAKAQAKRAYDSRLIGTLVDNVVPVSPQDDTDEDTMPVFTLQVAEDNPDFGLKKGQRLGVQVPVYGVLGLKKELEDNKVIYQPATPTSDGLMSANDKEKLDGLQQYTEATEEQAGIMSPLDKIKLNKLKEEPVNNIQIKDNITDYTYLLSVTNGQLSLTRSDINDS
ncbi:phage tail protein [Ligilactobacillus acidipiscis]|uniref:phage tail protein n=1 Tax=Ligilactobacillus acidipiscis TaxID=89059 RepID=UPI0022E12F59|nr:phage tail protein [Ligilactobacillus acidipiscis]